jgi:hypothetical protein
MKPPPGIPFVITLAMKEALRARGKSDDEVASLTPAQAHEILRKPNGDDLPPHAVASEESDLESEPPPDKPSTSPGVPDRAEAARFLALLDPTATRFTFQTFDDKKDRKNPALVRMLHGTLDECFAELTRLNNLGAGIFITINETDFRGRSTKNIVRVRALFGDADGEEQVEHSTAVIEECDAPPSMIVESGGGQHYYYLGADIPLDQFSPLQKSLAFKLGTDGNVHDLPRVMRLPGTLHLKDPTTPRLVRLLQANGATWQRSDLIAKLGLSATLNRKGEKQPDKIEIADAFKHLDPKQKLGESIERPEYPLLDFKPIKAECGWLRHVHDTGGEDQSEPLWWLALKCGIYLENGKKLIHEFSEKYPRYTREETEAKFEHVCKDQKANDLGWPLCKTICDHGSSQCKTCPHLTAEGSPLHLGLQYQEPSAAPEAEPLVVPRDLWAKFDVPVLPTGLLPEVIEKFTFAQAGLMGCDPAAIAMGALTVCAAVIPDEIKLQVKRYDPKWLESTRLWTGLVGLPSTMKSPAMLRALEPLTAIDKRLTIRFMQEMEAYEKLSAEERKGREKPKHSRLILEDTTPEGAQPVLRDNPNGMLLFRDELAGWFGSMDKYSGHRGAASDRGFWLRAFNGGHYYVDRISRKGNVPNLSVSMLGGIQVEPLRALVAEGVDDGLIQRMFPIMLRPAVLGKDEPIPANQYDELVERLNKMPSRIVQFDEAAQQIRQKLEQKHLDLMAYESVNRKLAAHIGKYNGLFARLCLLWHCIETVDAEEMIATHNIDADTAQRVADFLHGFLLPHAISFYVDVVGLADDHDRLENVAGYILAHKLERITNRDVARGDRSMRKLERQDVESIFNRLDALGWISKVQGRRISDVQWVVNPEVHRRFEEHAKREAERRQRERKAIAIVITQGKE